MRFSGHVQEPTIEPYAGLSGGRAWLDTFVASGSKFAMFPFLIDTGSSATTLHPQDALELLGDDYFQIDFANDPHRVSARGVGGVVNRVVRHATLGITSIDREPYFLRMRILIAEPTQSAPRGHGNWQLPSVLGRDFLRHFRLELVCGEARRVVLETL